MALAQTVYPEAIEAHPDAIEGKVWKGTLDEAEAGDMVICRNTKPLFIAFFFFLQKDVKSFIVGRDLEKGLISLSESVRGTTKEKVSKNIDNKLETLYQELKADGISKPENSPKYIALLEKAEIVLFILEKVKYPFDLIPKIEEIFHEDKKAILLTSGHRAKGLECDRVFFIETVKGEKLLPSKYAVLDWQIQQEENLKFVIYTRAKKDFCFINL